jgi:hypothetical protein
MRRLRRDHQVGAMVGQAAALRRRHLVGDLGMLGRGRDLRRARVGRDHAREARGQQQRELARAAAAIERELVARGAVGQQVRQRRRIDGPEVRVARGDAEK